MILSADRRRLGESVVFFCATLFLSLVLGFAVATPQYLAYGIFLVALVSGVAVAAASPTIAVLFILTTAATLGTVRRFIDYAIPGSDGTGVLVLLPSAISLATLALVGAPGLGVPRSPMTRAWLAVAFAVAIAALNPRGTGLGSNVQAGLLLLAGMTLFLIAQSGTVRSRPVIATVGALALLNSAVMLFQELFGLTPWDQKWVSENGYASLYITADHVRPLGITSSAAESASLATVGLVIFGCSLSFKKPLGGLLNAIAAVVCLSAVFVGGTRTYLVLGVLAIAWFYALRTAVRFRRLVVAGAIAVLGVVVAANILIERVTSPGARRILGVITGAENIADSTIPLHLELVSEGLQQGIRSLLGTGAGQVSVLAERSRSTEFDLSNAAMMAGVVGGASLVLFYVATMRTLALAAAAHTTSVQPQLLTAVVLSSFGQWLNIGYYLLVPIVWTCLGLLDKGGKLK